MSLKFVAVDVGSNAIRLIFYEVRNNDKVPIYKKVALYRVALRLGEDAFLKGKILQNKSKKLLKVMEAFRCLIDVYEPQGVMACATSAMREAKNGEMLAKKIQKEYGIPLRVITGKEEASIIFTNNVEASLEKNEYYLYVDVGGGSTELTLLKNKKVKATESFNIGTVRMLNKIDKPTEWKKMFHWLKNLNEYFMDAIMIGSGGNINKLYKLAKNDLSYTLSDAQLKNIKNKIEALSYEERILELKLKPDRADVIIPAAIIYKSIMDKTGIKTVYIPQFGLADGMIHRLYENYMKK